MSISNIVELSKHFKKESQNLEGSLPNMSYPLDQWVQHVDYNVMKIVTNFKINELFSESPPSSFIIEILGRTIDL